MQRDERDYILRLLAAAAAALGRLRERLAANAQPAEVIREARAAQGELLGRDAMLLQALDPASAAALLDPKRVALWAELLRVEAAAHRQAGQEREAAALEARAAALDRRS
ncbi:MAG TPA: hypothetical protein VKA84_25485 [Gemmatimonadaceae bacterium]|nr:hypothetical protein [Gemmatimonadaceae bacterium]